MTFNEYRARHCKGYSRPLARKLYNMYLETEKVSTDMNITNSFPAGAIWNNMMVCDEMVSFAPSTPQVCNSVPCAKAKGNNPMYVDNDKHIESSKINYLLSRLENLEYTKRTALEEQFGLRNDIAPDTAQAMVDRIQAGKFVLKADTKDKSVYEPTRYIVWRDPAVKEDQAGYKIAVKAMDDAAQNVRDLIAIDTPANALAAVKAFEAWTYTAPTATA
jgi:hypothetical protein